MGGVIDSGIVLGSIWVAGGKESGIVSGSLCWRWDRIRNSVRHYLGEV